MEQTLISTHIPELGSPTRGKVRDIYHTDSNIVIIACDRISVFDQILPTPIKDKGKVLNLLAAYWFEKTADIISNHVLAIPDPNILIARRCRPLPIEVVVRGYIAGSMWRDYESGKKTKCGVMLPEGLHKHDPLPAPIITPTTKNKSGHDVDISDAELIKNGIVSESLWIKIKKTSLALFQRGTELLDKKEMVLVDTKYEFGIDDKDNLVLIDEIHTPDSSRFWFKNDPDKQFKDKENARIWAADQGFKGEGKIPEIPLEIANQIQQGYLKIFESVMGAPCPETEGDIPSRIRSNLKKTGVI